MRKSAACNVGKSIDGKEPRGKITRGRKSLPEEKRGRGKTRKKENV
jgi:hypothetical protein